MTLLLAAAQGSKVTLEQAFPYVVGVVVALVIVITYVTGKARRRSASSARSYAPASPLRSWPAPQAPRSTDIETNRGEASGSGHGARLVGAHSGGTISSGNQALPMGSSVEGKTSFDQQFGPFPRDDTFRHRGYYWVSWSGSTAHPD